MAMFFNLSEAQKNPEAIQNKIDAVLERVIDHQTDSPIADIGLVEKIRFLKGKRQMLVFCRSIHVDHACCMVFNNAAYDQTLDELRNALQNEFPGINVKFVF